MSNINSKSTFQFEHGISEFYSLQLRRKLKISQVNNSVVQNDPSKIDSLLHA
jgi:hypothetical protein